MGYMLQFTHPYVALQSACGSKEALNLSLQTKGAKMCPHGAYIPDLPTMYILSY